MIWTKYKIETKVEATDIVASVLFDNGIVGVEIEDNLNLSSEDLKKIYVDIPKINEENDIAYVIFYVALFDDKIQYDEAIKQKSNVNFNKSIDNSYMKSYDNIFMKDNFMKVLSKIKLDISEYQDLIDMGSLNITYDTIDDEIFLNKWKENFKAIDLGDVIILPSFDKRKTYDNKINIYIDPGTAFGTGQHATTKLIIDSIIDYKKENDTTYKKFLDVGTGSGILSILAYKIGFDKVCAIDVDSYVESNLIDNLRLNNIIDYKKYDYKNGLMIDDKLYHDIKFIYAFGNIIDDVHFRKRVATYKYDLITINILAPIIISMIENADIKSMLSVNGHLILSGIIKEYEKNVENALKSRLNIYKKAYIDDWVMIDACL